MSKADPAHQSPPSTAVDFLASAPAHGCSTAEVLGADVAERIVRVEGDLAPWTAAPEHQEKMERKAAPTRRSSRRCQSGGGAQPIEKLTAVIDEELGKVKAALGPGCPSMEPVRRAGRYVSL